MPAPSRPIPHVGMPVRVVYLGAVEEDRVIAVADDGRALTVGGARYTLRRLNGRFVREDEPYYGVHLSLGSGAPPDA